MCTGSDLAFCNSYEDGTSTNREPHQAYKTAEVGHSQPAMGSGMGHVSLRVAQ